MKAIGMVGLFLVIVFLSLSCHNVDPNPINVDIFIDLRMLDKSGNNLLNSSTSGFYKPEDIRIFFLKKGIKTEVYDPRLAGPRNFLIFDNGNGQNFMRLTPDEGTTDQEITTTFIQWRLNDEDTVKTTMTRIRGTVYCSKVFYNSVLKYDASTSQPVSWGTGTYRRLIDVQK